MSDYTGLSGAYVAQRFGSEAPNAAEFEVVETPEFECTDLGNARRLIHRHGVDLRFHVASHRWLVFDGQRYVPDETHEVQRLAKDAALSIYNEAASAEDSKLKERLAAWAIRSQAGQRLREMVELAISEPGIPVTAQALDRDPWAFNVLNGTLDLRTGVLHPHDRADLITKLAPVTFDPSATCPTFDAFLRRILSDDAETLAFIQRAVGYSLTGLVTEQVLFLLYGTGANGKTRFLESQRLLLGGYSAQADFSSFTERRGEGPRNDLARLHGARLVLSSEANEGRHLDEAVVKQLTGGDTIAARFLYGEHFEFRPQFKLWLAANHRPNVRSVGEAMWRRIRLIPFQVTIPESERDPQLGEKLAAELPGILNWAVDGCLAWQRGGLGGAPAVRAATDEYRQEMDELAGFLADRCSLNPLAKTPASELYTAYRAWCGGAGERVQSQRWFGLRLGERPGLAKRKTARAVVWHGVGLVEHMDDRARVSVNPPYETASVGYIGSKVQQGASSTSTERGDAWEQEEPAA
jgi:putative DNA primase/helicase